MHGNIRKFNLTTECLINNDKLKCVYSQCVKIEFYLLFIIVEIQKCMQNHFVNIEIKHLYIKLHYFINP